MNVARVADLLGLILFAALFVYFLQKPERTRIEQLFLLLTGGAAMIDAVFFIDYLNKKQMK